MFVGESSHSFKLFQYCLSNAISCVNVFLGYLYYYRRAVLTNLSSTFDENLPARSQSNSDHRVIFLRLHLGNPLPLCDPFLRLSFVFYDKKESKNHKCGESVSIGVIDQVRSANVDPNALLQINR